MVYRVKLSASLATLALLVGCQSSRVCHDPEYHQVVCSTPLSLGANNHALVSYESVAPDITGQHAVEEYIQIALERNPKIHAIRKRMESLAYRVPVESSLQDPMVTWTIQPEPVQTAAGKQESILAISQRFPWFGKLAAKANMAEAQTNAARAELAAVELSVVTQVRIAYFELYLIQESIDVTEAEQQLLLEIRDVANTRYATGDASQQDVLRANLEIAEVENQLVRLRERLALGQAKLARLLHISPQSKPLPQKTLPTVPEYEELETIYAAAETARPELHAKLAKLNASRFAVESARLEYNPDFNLGLSWISVDNSGVSPVANGNDSLLLSAGFNLPIYQRRISSAVRSAEAQVVADAREYDALRDESLEQVTALYTEIQSRFELLQLYRNDILPTAKQTLEVSTRAYNVNEVDFLQLLDNWRQVLRYELEVLRLETSLFQSMAKLDQFVGGIEIVKHTDFDEIPVASLSESSRR